jgi:hypothetical protein
MAGMLVKDFSSVPPWAWFIILLIAIGAGFLRYWSGRNADDGKPTTLFTKDEDPN